MEAITRTAIYSSFRSLGATRNASQRNRDLTEIPSIRRTESHRLSRAAYRRYEADRWRVMLYDRAAGRIENLTETFDRSAEELGGRRTTRRLLHGGKRDAEAGLCDGGALWRATETNYHRHITIPRFLSARTGRRWFLSGRA